MFQNPILNGTTGISHVLPLGWPSNKTSTHHKCVFKTQMKENYAQSSVYNGGGRRASDDAMPEAAASL